jgi:ACS family tartrate transporter-like MFS transporter
MAAESPASGTDFGVDPRVVRRKVAWRIVPLVFVLYIVSYLDRVNLSFAQLSMKSALDFSDAVFGWGVGIFFVGYQLLEIPGALLVEHWSARKWFARIMVTWGLCSMGMALVQTPWQFYLARFLLGLAEAGFFPGIIVYFTHWFPRADRARALAGLVLAVPVSLVLGAWFSRYLLKADWFDVAGWQWVFLIEGLPAVLLGLAVPFLMTDRPRQAKWLAPGERAWLEQTLAAERQAASGPADDPAPARRRSTVFLLALGILATNTGGYALVFWLPEAIKSFLQSTGRETDESAVLAWTTWIFVFGVAGVWLSGQSSDRTGERKWHCVAGQVLTGVFLAASVVPGQSWEAVFGWLCLVGFFGYFWPPPFWVLPTLTLSASAAAVAIGIINMCANVAGIIGPPVFGLMRDAGWDDRVCLLSLAACYAAGGVIVALIRVPRKRPATQLPAEEPSGRAIDGTGLGASLS